MKWFSNPQTVEELKKQYKKLAFEHHPDRGGNEEHMKEINAEYDKLFEQLKNTHSSPDGKTYTTKAETDETPEEFRAVINRLISLEGVQVEICGSWLWVSGNTYPHRETLKHLKFRFSKSKTAWYFHDTNYRKRNNKSFTLDEIRDLFGSELVTSQPQLKLEVV